MVSTAIILFCTCAAFVAGFIDSIAGGGGLITIPALLLSGLPPQLALGTNKVGCCLGTGVAMLNFARSNLILWRLALLGVGFSLVGAGIGTELALYISPDLLGKVLVLLLPFAMLATLMPKKEQKKPPLTSGRRYWILAPLCFLIVGIYDGFFGPGAGTLMIMLLGLFAFIFDTVGGVMFAKFLNLFTKKKINPMIGACGISAFPMSSRVVHKMGLKEDPQNFLLMHAAGVNVGGQIASVIAGGLILNLIARV